MTPPVHDDHPAVAPAPSAPPAVEPPPDLPPEEVGGPESDENPRWQRVAETAATVALGALVGLGLYLIWRQTAPPAESELPEPEPALPPARERGWISGPAGGVFIDAAVDESEDALPVLFVHGLAGTLEHWRPVVDLLDRHPRFGDAIPRPRTVLLDLRGHGRSDEPAAPRYGVSDYAADIGAVADVLGLSRFVLVGHSMGALAAIACAARRPGRIPGLALVDPTADSSGQPSGAVEALLSAVRDDAHGEFELHYRQFLAGASDETRRRVLTDLETTEGEVLAESLAASTTYETTETLETYKGPKIIVSSPLNDLPTSLHRLRPDIRHLPLRDTSHWIMLDRPRELANMLAAFVASVSR